MRPSYIYLGRAELLAINQATVLYTYTKLGNKITIFGYEVYEINADSHLSVGM